ncbi:hypothetical protein AAGW04_05690 [Pectobacterium aroidearum]|uniref:hypothetical protein n=1 Tax=Pectobacterium aroidearum TaxID=1201031 RepID=UPI00211595DC|nr:hypothetical protein [Pectobacterium aroidearum]UUE42642.1 hypothetical protein L0Y25_10275 [Pectobacterium aroidearum]
MLYITTEAIITTEGDEVEHDVRNNIGGLVPSEKSFRRENGGIKKTVSRIIQIMIGRQKRRLSLG